MTQRPDVVVVGVGRSGTTNTARIVHEYFKVCMGHRFAIPSTALPHGGYEDERLIAKSRGLAEKHRLNAHEWIEQWEKSHNRHGCKALFKGTKQTALCNATRDMWLSIRPELIIRTHRPEELVVASMLKWRSKTRGRDHWVRFVRGRENAMDTHLVDLPVPIVHVYYTKEYMEDEDLIDYLRPHIEEMKCRKLKRVGRGAT